MQSLTSGNLLISNLSQNDRQVDSKTASESDIVGQLLKVFHTCYNLKIVFFWGTKIILWRDGWLRLFAFIYEKISQPKKKISKNQRNVRSWFERITGILKCRWSCLYTLDCVLKCRNAATYWTVSWAFSNNFATFCDELLSIEEDFDGRNDSDISSAILQRQIRIEHNIIFMSIFNQQNPDIFESIKNFSANSLFPGNILKEWKHKSALWPVHYVQVKCARKIFKRSSTQLK